MSARNVPHGAPGDRPIACLSCGACRVVFGNNERDAGECPRCGYLGWTYTEAIDAGTRRMIMNGQFARRSAAPRRPSRSFAR